MLNFSLFTTSLLMLFLPAFSQAQTKVEQPWVRKVVFGLVAHDRGPFSDKHEGGVDPNWEIQLNPPRWKYWRWLGSPLPIIGATPNFNGDTSVFYGGVNYEFKLSNKTLDAWTYNLTKTLFVAGGLSAAIHTGPLHNNRHDDCNEHSDCGFGYRVLPRLHIELGTNFRENHGLSLIYDHLSHKGILPGENEGIDHIGLRYHYTFKIP
jgi:hypothetical protein